MVDLVALKDLLQPVYPLVGVAVGAVMAGFGQLYKARRERKRAIAMALSDLLEVRHRVVHLNEVIKYIQGVAKIPSLAMPHMRNLLDQLIPSDNKLDARFNDAVSLLAGMDPLLAYELRSKNTLPLLLSRIRALVASTGEGLADYESTEIALVEAMTPAINQAVLLVAKKHSWSTYWRVKDHVGSKESIEEKLAPLMSIIGAVNRGAQDLAHGPEQGSNPPIAA